MPSCRELAIRTLTEETLRGREDLPAGALALVPVTRALVAILAAVVAFPFVAEASASATGATAASAATAGASAVTVSPMPGTPDASPQTQISVLGVPRAQISSIRVTGSSSGLVRGAFHAYSGRRGASFVLSRPLTQGEQVRVVLGIRRELTRRWAFTVAQPTPTPPTLNLPIQQSDKLQHFVSRPDLTPPKITVLKRTSGGSKGDIFITPIPSPTVHPESNNAITIHPVGPGGPMIIDRQGNVVWFDQLKPPVYALNLRQQQFAGHKVLTWWQGTVTVQAWGQGEGVIADPRYRTIRTVKAGNGYPTDVHEFTLTPAGDALVTIYSPIKVHLRGTPPGQLTEMLDAIVQEIDVRTGLVVWEWHAYGHIPLADSYATPKNSSDYDAFHVNAIEPAPGNRLFISARDTSAVYLVDRATGAIEWTLGGKASCFTLRPGARFWFQHDAHMLAPNRISVFDDEAGPPLKAPSSRGLILSLDLRHRIARVAHQYHRPGTTSAQSEGSVQPLANGNVFVGFGSTEFFSEFSSSGRLVFDASLPTDDGSYREYTFPWSATPMTRPDIAARKATAGIGVDVYASWNGATTVARWQVLGGASASSLAPSRATDSKPISLCQLRRPSSPSRRSTLAGTSWPKAEMCGLHDRPDSRSPRTGDRSREGHARDRSGSALGTGHELESAAERLEPHPLGRDPDVTAGKLLGEHGRIESAAVIGHREDALAAVLAQRDRELRRVRVLDDVRDQLAGDAEQHPVDFLVYRQLIEGERELEAAALRRAAPRSPRPVAPPPRVPPRQARADAARRSPSAAGGPHRAASRLLGRARARSAA